MGELEVVLSSEKAWTRFDVRDMSVDIGLTPDDTVIVHSSLSSMGWVCGGAQAVIEGLLDVLSEAGTLIMPAHTGGNSEPSHWANPPVPESWWETIRATMPAFEPKCTPTRGIGCIAELFRTWPGVRRSMHPQVSFSALGRNAGFITSSHTSLAAFGKDCPLERIYELNGKILLIGVGHDRNTSMHLGEARSGTCELIAQGAAILKDGMRQWARFQDIDVDSDRFPAIAEAFEAEGGTIRRGDICEARTQLLSQRAIVDFTERYLRGMKE